ncbi:hypothetical protein MiSe_81340 [Microseira wollei NIES-4236]|uniref:Uncharacterized protein n=1 Tax=Microseira wollei NIES-4236 TaxID=2530354 RepID=A0AAV3XRQ6_9CYAN|nr:hypothetical protein MiSe_81340 [Microseira wollei NIES-4236]
MQPRDLSDPEEVVTEMCDRSCACAKGRSLVLKP